MGGVGTTALIEHLSQYVPVNPAHGAYNPLKHCLRPPKLSGVQCAIFVFGDPADAMASLFRRGLDAAHFRNIFALEPAPDPLIDEDPWSATVGRFGLHETHPGHWEDDRGRAASHIGAMTWLAQRKIAAQQAISLRDQQTRRTAGYRDLDDVLARDLDPFGWQQQWAGWSEAAPPYPIMIVRYQALWSRMADILAFVGAPAQELMIPFAPWRSRIGASKMSGKMQVRLRAWARRHAASISAWPDLSVIAAAPIDP